MRPLIFLVILVVIAGVLGYLIYQKSISLPKKEPAQSQPAANNSQAKSERSDAATLTDEEKEVLNPPSQGANEAEMKKHFELVQKLAKEPDFLEVAKCEVRPVVTRLRNSKTFQVRNQDSIDHTIVVDKDHTYSISAGSTQTIPVDFGHGAGVYGFGCDDSTSAVGMLFVTE